jgi:hypothetical protein
MDCRTIACVAAPPVDAHGATDPLTPTRRLLIWLVLIVAGALHATGLVLGSAAREGPQPMIVQGPIAYLGGALIGAAYGTVFAVLAPELKPRPAGVIPA